MPEPRPAYVRLATVSDLMAARITVARLEAEGIPARVYGEGLGPYRLTVGDFATTEVWVAEDRLEEARTLMLASEIDAIPEAPQSAPERMPRGLIVLGSIALLAVIAYRLLAAL